MDKEHPAQMARDIRRLQETVATLCAWLADVLGRDAASELIKSIYEDTRISKPRTIKRAKKK